MGSRNVSDPIEMDNQIDREPTAKTTKHNHTVYACREKAGVDAYGQIIDHRSIRDGAFWCFGLMGRSNVTKETERKICSQGVDCQTADHCRRSDSIEGREKIQVRRM